MERGLDEPPIDVRPGVPAEMSILAPNEVDAYLVDRPDLHPADVHARLRRGAQCFAVRCGGRIVHAGWATTGEARIDFLWCRLPLAPGEVYQFGSFTHPDFRGLNLAAVRIALDGPSAPRRRSATAHRSGRPQERPRLSTAREVRLSAGRMDGGGEIRRLAAARLRAPPLIGLGGRPEEPFAAVPGRGGRLR